VGWLRGFVLGKFGKVDEFMKCSERGMFPAVLGKILGWGIGEDGGRILGKKTGDIDVNCFIELNWDC